MTSIKTMQLAIVSAHEEIFTGEVIMVSMIAETGMLGIAPGHAPLLTTLRPGPVCLTKPNQEQEIFYVSSGFLEVQPTFVTVLSDTAARENELDEAAANRAKMAAEEAFSGRHTALDMKKAAVQLAEAIAQIRTIKEIQRLRQGKSRLR